MAEDSEKKEIIKSSRNGLIIINHPNLFFFNIGKHFSFWSIIERSPFVLTSHIVEDGIDSGNILFI